MVDVADTTETMMSLNLRQEPKCRSKDPIVLVDDLDVTNLRKIIMLNMATCFLLTLFLLFECKQCGAFTRSHLKQPVICTVSWVISTLTLLAVSKYTTNLINYDSNLNYILAVN